MMSTGSPVGILNINKPAGMTSRRVVDRVAEIVHPAKAGHAGTLDPLAEGVLVVCVGQATRLVSYVQQQPKTYRARFELGKTSDTDDVTGKIEEVEEVSLPGREQIERLLPRFTGAIQQVPPKYSAVQIRGRRAHRLAREGKPVPLRARTVHVHAISLMHDADGEIELQIECGSGVYVRSLGRDLGKELGCGAIMSRLARTRVGVYRLSESLDFHALDPTTLPEALLPARTAVAGLPMLRVGQPALDDLRHGRTFSAPDEAECTESEFVAVLTPDGTLACVAQYRESEGKLAPKQVFIGAGTSA